MTSASDHNLATEYFALARPLNALIAFVVILAAGVIASTSSTDWMNVVVAAVAGTLLASAANMINDVFDVEIDRINKPNRPLPAGRMSPRTASFAALLTALAGVCLSLVAGTGIFLIALVSSVLIYMYSAWLKHVPLLGNLTVAALTAVAFLYGALAAGSMRAGIVPALFAFGYNFGREILKDVEDIEGDRAAGIPTLPVVAGVRAALWTVTGVFALVLAGTVLPYLFKVFDLVYLLIVIPGVDVPLLAVSLSMWRNPKPENLSKLNSWLKYGMLAGVLAMAAGSL